MRHFKLILTFLSRVKILILLGITPLPSHATDPAHPGKPLQVENICDNILRNILRNVVIADGTQALDGKPFERNRGLLDLLRSLPFEAGAKIATLGPKQLILDAGAGELVFPEEFLSNRRDELIKAEETLYFGHGAIPGSPFRIRPLLDEIFNTPIQNRPHILAVTKNLSRPINLADFQGKLSTITGEFFEDIENSLLGRPDVILDSFGVMSYTENPSLVLEKYLEILQKEGEIYIVLDHLSRPANNGEALELPAQSSGVIFGSPGNEWLSRNLNRTTIQTKNGKTVTLIQWLYDLNKTGLNVQIKETDFALWFPHAAKDPKKVRRSITVMIHKSGARFDIPKLRLIKADNTINPPSRMFVEI